MFKSCVRVPEALPGRGCHLDPGVVVGLLLSCLFLFLVGCGLVVLEIVGLVLLLAGAALFVQHFTVERQLCVAHGLPARTPVAPYVLGGIGVLVLIPASAGLCLGSSFL
jgi:uncharacterized membrane protein YgaE (UPF0421/DUF939 family)